MVPMHGSQMIYATLLILLASCDPALVALFTPAHPRLGRYEVCASGDPLQPVNGGAIEVLEALDAFGTAGAYDRPALSRLYGGTRVQVARGWTRTGDRFESITRLSPYPDASLTHLLAGTLEIRFIAILSP
ncbi:MAG: hypothetical protein JWL71_5096 [Acidobacteria bacterium]|nr:hypothetical protein [Acidobacteriota bacterium]